MTIRYFLLLLHVFNCVTRKNLEAEAVGITYRSVQGKKKKGGGGGKGKKENGNESQRHASIQNNYSITRQKDRRIRDKVFLL